MVSTTKAGVTLAVAVLVALPVAGCAEEEPATNQPTITTQEQAPGQTGVGEEGQGGAAQESLEGKIGQTVTMTGEVATVIAQDAFTIGGDEIGENPALVVGADMPAGLSPGDTVRVTGTVQRFQVAGWEEDLDLDLVDQEFEDFDNDPAIQASSVTKI